MMPFKVTFVERRDRDSPSIERVFRSIAGNLSHQISTRFERVRSGNNFIGTLSNLAFFRPKSGSDVYHVTGHVTYLGLVLPRKNTVLTFHDLTILDFRKGLRRWLITKLYFVWPARRVRYLTAISEATKSRLVQLSNVPPEKIIVIENPLTVKEVDNIDEFKETDPTVLQIGTAVNKNLDRVAHAVASLDYRLHIVGSISEELRTRLNELSVNFTNSEDLTDEKMENAYLEADIVAFCSTDEGFGLPIIEAQAKGKPVVTSDRSPMKEVAGDGAILVDPESIESIKEGLETVVQNPVVRADLIAKGKQNIRRFDPQRIAKQYLELYQSVKRDV